MSATTTTDTTTAAGYTYRVEPTDTTPGTTTAYTATCIQRPAITATAPTPQQALTAAITAAAASSDLEHYSGAISLRISPTLHAAIDGQAYAAGKSANRWIAETLATATGIPTNNALPTQRTRRRKT